MRHHREDAPAMRHHREDAATDPEPSARHALRRPSDADPARGAFSHNTERARRADLDIFRSWCAARDACPMPARPELVAAFVDAMADSRAPATVRRYIASIAAAHRAADAVDPATSARVKYALKRMHRRRGSQQQQAHGLTWPLRQQLLEAAGERLIDTRNRALVAVAYDSMLRRSELAGARVADLAPDPSGGATLLVRRSKTDPHGRTATVYLAGDTVSIVDEWLSRAGVSDGHLFRSVPKSGKVGPRLHPSQIPRIFKAMARAAGLDDEVVAALSGHSARVGAAQDMIAAGIELPAILHAGRWKTATMVTRYGERLLAHRSGAAQLARRQGRE